MKDKVNIYIVEDEKIVAMDIRNHLNSIGYNVLGISSSGEECLEKVKILQPDLILMDINLSGELTGIETAEKLGQIINVPVVFLTAYTDDKTLKEIKRTGYYGYVTKPFKEIDLKTEIEFTIDRFNKVQKLKKEHDASKTSLKETEEFFKQVVDNVSDFIYRIDLKGNFTYVNPSALKQTGYTNQELLSMKYTNLVRNDFKQKAYFFFKNIFQNKIENSYFEFPMVTRNGDEMWIGQKIHLLRSNASIVGFQVVARDITNEMAFKEQLILAKKNAENTAQIKSLFLANMSHEIRTPLNGIIGVINLLSNTDLTDKQQTYINAITSSSNQLLGIINDVLDLSKIEAGKMEIIESEFDLHELIQSVISIFEIKTFEKGIGLNFKINYNVPRLVIGDSIRLNQILYNLLGNAVKFTENGNVDLNVSIISDKEDQSEIEFCVSDSGIGMAEESMEKIFESFTQAEGETTRKFGGTGLGLAIVKKLVDLQGGTIQVSSRLNEGSCFKIRLKFGKVNEERRVKDVVENTDYTALRDMSILLVEDNPINQLVTKDLLMEKGAKVTIANNGQEALGILALHDTFSVVLMDMQMPVLDGYETMQQIRKYDDPSISNIPILALTANAIESEISKCYACGANNYLSKPFKPEILYQKICHLTSNKSMNDKKRTELVEEHFDVQTLSTFTNGKEDLMRSTLHELESCLKKELVNMKHAFDERKVEQIRSLAHKIKPNFMLIGMNRVGTLCKEIEQIDLTSDEMAKVQMLLDKIPEVIHEIELYSQSHFPQHEHS